MESHATAFSPDGGLTRAGIVVFVLVVVVVAEVASDVDSAV